MGTTDATIPVIDIGPFLDGSPSGMADVARRLDEACTYSGFFQIVNTGLDMAFVQDVYNAAEKFFDLPEDTKSTAAQPAPDQVRGWTGVGKEGLSYSLDAQAPGDLKEKFDIGPADVPSDDYFTCDAAGPHFAPNVWPTAMPEMRPLLERYFTEMGELSRQLMRMFALGLGLDVDFFEDKVDRHISMLRIMNYPDQADEPLPGQLRAGAHSDYGSLTIVRQEDRPGGLQVLAKDGSWLDVPVVQDGFVVNIGDLMAEWTNDTWVSTMHRVVNPSRDLAADSRRISLIFFHQPNYDALIECLPTCLLEGEEPRHDPITSGDHLYSKFVKQTTFGGTIGS
ncbi:isopenicillin N synthase family dioxygenase [Ilumatobacter sp.]|uniref:isopenicillin N synthase family dioxygenase n=1 Tax=Ilumatobacter sp. TaxID=1967498 RepID=UPI003C37C55C